MKKIFEAISCLMMGTMFLMFLVQIASRYILEDPFGWTLEVCLTLWIWIVFFGNAFIVKHEDHIKFDVLYQKSSERIQKIFSLIGATAVVIGMAYSFLPTWDYIDFMQLKRSATLEIPLRTVYSIYAVFIIGTVFMYSKRIYKILKYDEY